MTALRCLRRGERWMANIWLTTLLRLLLSRYVGELLFTVNRRTQAAPEARREVSGQSVTISDNAKAFLHAFAGLRPVPGYRHRPDHRDHLVHHVMRQVTVQHPVARVD